MKSLLDWIKKSFSLVKDWFCMFFQFLSAFIKSKEAIALENMALKSQLSLLQEKLINKKIPQPKSNFSFRWLWVTLSKKLENWKSLLFLFKPETIISWHKNLFKKYWKKKSQRGRPCISQKTIYLIKRIHKENPLLSPEKIHEKLLQLNVVDAPCPNTIAKYLPQTRKPFSEKQRQSWRTFLKNHAKDTWAMDAFVVPTLSFKILYVLVIMKLDRREIKHIAVTDCFNGEWTKTQLREATSFNDVPKYLIHDNDPVFTSGVVQKFLEASHVKSKRIAPHSPWQNGICERHIKTIREELLNHIIPLNRKHLSSLLKEYVQSYYNVERTHQGIGCETPIPKVVPLPSRIEDTKWKATPILNGLYSSYEKIA